MLDMNHWGEVCGNSISRTESSGPMTLVMRAKHVAVSWWRRHFRSHACCCFLQIIIIPCKNSASAVTMLETAVTTELRFKLWIMNSGNMDLERYLHFCNIYDNCLWKLSVAVSFKLVPLLFILQHGYRFWFKNSLKFSWFNFFLTNCRLRVLSIKPQYLYGLALGFQKIISGFRNTEGNTASVLWCIYYSSTFLSYDSEWRRVIPPGKVCLMTFLVVSLHGPLCQRVRIISNRFVIMWMSNVPDS